MIIKYFLILICILFISEEAIACKCKAINAKTVFNEADFVIKAEFVKRDKLNGTFTELEKYIDIKLRVVDTYKGKLKKGDIVTAKIKIAGMCTPKFKERDKEVIIQLYQEKGFLKGPSLCSQIFQKSWKRFLKIKN